MSNSKTGRLYRMIDTGRWYVCVNRSHRKVSVDPETLPANTYPGQVVKFVEQKNNPFAKVVRE